MAHSLQCFPVTLAAMVLEAPARGSQVVIAAGAGVVTDIGASDMRNPLAVSTLDDLLLEVFEGVYGTPGSVFLYLPVRTAPLFLIVPSSEVSIRVTNITGARVAYAWRATLEHTQNHDEDGT